MAETAPLPVPAERRARRRPRAGSLLGGATLTVVILATALTSFVWTPFAPDDTGAGIRLGAPSAEHWAGTDKLGRDLFTQLMVGARLAVVVAAGSVAIAAALGISLGLLAAVSRRWLDESLSYLFDVMIALPAVLIAMLIVTVQGASTGSAILASGLSFTAIVARLTRVSAARVLTTDYVRAGRASGTGTLGLLRRHVLPNISPILIVQLTLMASSAILVEASLSYLGLGTAPPTASWGRMLLEAQTSVETAPWGALFPGFAILLTVMGLNFLGDGLREVMDPQRGAGDD